MTMPLKALDVDGGSGGGVFQSTMFTSSVKLLDTNGGRPARHLSPHQHQRGGVMGLSLSKLTIVAIIIGIIISIINPEVAFCKDLFDRRRRRQSFVI